MDSSYRPEASRHIESLLRAIAKMPESWALTLCVGKQNLWPRWNSEPLSREELVAAVRSQTNREGKPTAWSGVSLVTGPMSGGIMAVDFDGPLALQKYSELSGGQIPPTTMRWTSGKPGHFQILLSVPPEKWGNLKPQKIELENSEKLELRWNQCSTLPPSIHPDTQQPYFWKNEGAIAPAPNWILDLMREAPPVELPKKATEKNTIYIDVEKSLVDILESEIIPRIDAVDFYQNWVALKASGKNFKGLCPFHQEKTASFTVSPDTCTYHCFGCGVGGGPVQFLYQIKGGSGSPIGKDFAEVVRELADRVGVRMPEFEPRSKTQNPKSNNQSKVISHPKFEAPEVASLSDEIDRLLAADLKRSELHLKFAELARTYRLSSSEVSKTYYLKSEEAEKEADREDVVAEIENLLSAHKSSIALTEVLPAGLASPIDKLAKMLNLRSECYLAALLTQVSSLFKVGTETMLRRNSDWRCVPNYFAGIVGESSQLKSPIPKAIIERPMRALREKAAKEFELAEANYEAELNTWKAAKKEEDRGPAPKPPRERIYNFDKATGEGIIYQVAAFPDQALMYFCDELAGLFKSANQYRGGKGSDEEDLLSFWNGTGSTILRASGVKAKIEGLLLSIFGTIQPDVLAYLLKDCSDSNGKFARFDFVFQPLAAPKLSTEDEGRFDLTPMLADLYQKIDALPAIYFEFDKSAKTYFYTFTNKCHERRVKEPKQGMRAALGKMPEKVGKLATVIHTVTCVFNGQQVTNLIPRSAVESAVRFVKFASDQVASLYTEFSDRSALAPNLAKIVLLAERKGGVISIRDGQLAFNSKFRPTAQVVREYFRELVALNYGTIKTSGKSFQFELAPTPTVPTNSSNSVTAILSTSTSENNPAYSAYSETASTVGTVGVCRHPRLQSESLPSEDYSPIVGTVGGFSTFENSPIDESVTNSAFSESAVTDFQNSCSQVSENYLRIAEAVTVPTNQPQNLMAHDIESVGDPPTNAYSAYSSQLNEDETDILEMMQRAISEKDCCLAQDIVPVLKNVCDSGAADRKKVWGALTAENQKIFTALTKVVVPPEILEALDAIGILLADGNSLEVDMLYSVFAPETIDRAIEFLGTSDKAKFSGWLAEKKLADSMAAAFYQPSVLSQIVADNSAGDIERAIARIEKGDQDMADEIRDLLER